MPIRPRDVDIEIAGELLPNCDTDNLIEQLGYAGLLLQHGSLDDQKRFVVSRIIATVETRQISAETAAKINIIKTLLARA